MFFYPGGEGAQRPGHGRRRADLLPAGHPPADHGDDEEIQPGTNAINILQACIYKFVKTGQFLGSMKKTCVVKFNILMLVFTFKYELL